MKHESIKPSRGASHRIFSLLTLATILAVSGCAGTKDGYPAIAEGQQRQAAEEATLSKAGANIDTQATYLKLIDQMQQEGLWFASLAHIDALEQRWGVTPETTRARADALRHAGQVQSSEVAYKRLIGTRLEAAGYHGLGLLSGEKGNFQDAVRLLNEAQRRNPTDATLLSDLGYASLRAGLISDARLPLMQALQLRPDNPQAQANLAVYFLVSRQDDQATALMNASKLSPVTRAAIADTARQLGVASTAQGSDTPTDTSTPLSLKASRSTSSFSPSTASRGTP
jgi:Flp pilus assembly protein TadD